MYVSDIMRQRQALVTVSPEADLEEVVYRFDNSVSLSRLIYVISEQDLLLGVVGAADILALLLPRAKELPNGAAQDRSLFERALAEHIGEHRSRSVAHIMRTDYPSAKPGHPLVQATDLLLDSGAWVMPVLDDKGILAGEITRRLLLRYTAHAVLQMPPN
ncbi:MAG: CBS domain-containing protein [Desulfovibrio sp.]|nr:MAG: CBS domain-containing protein [Desulfovibrio sp.]